MKLTLREKLVFYGLVKWPELNDKELANKLNLRRSTVTVIRNKLRKKNYYEKFNLPNFKAIGCELMALNYGTFSTKTPLRMRQEKKITQELASFPELIFSFSTDTTFLGILASKSITELEKIRLFSLQNHVDVIEEVNANYFPFDLYDFSLFNFASLLKNAFKLDINDEITYKKEKKVFSELSANEKLVLYGSVKWPTYSDIKLAAVLKLSRPSISKIKHKLYEENFMSPIVIPDISKLQQEIIALVSCKSSPHKLDKEENKLIESFNFASIHRNQLCFLLGCHENYTTYQQYIDKIKKLYEKYKSDFSQLQMQVFPIKSISFVKINFAPLVKKILNIRTI